MKFLMGSAKGVFWLNASAVIIAFSPFILTFYVLRFLVRQYNDLTTFLEDNSGPNMNTNWVKKHANVK